MIKKQLIMEKALELFAQRGFEATSVQQITEHCGISKGAFYLSFKSKDELILALIDHFMVQVTVDVDYLVRNTTNHQELLHKFYFTLLDSFYRHSDFAKILMKEQSQSISKEFILKTRSYDIRFEESIQMMLERLYGNEIKDTKYDLIYCVKGFLRIYSELFLFHNVELDLERLSQSLVEKTNILARHSTIPFISEELNKLLQLPLEQEVTKEEIVKILEQKTKEVEEPIEKESLVLLLEHFSQPTLKPAIVKGLIENIRNHPQCNWIAYLLVKYYGF
ncbi:TetR/AcrR family transcriptional regulator [Sutcliffiella deserti]|uniref:TetR/AcrR family transcriptional regulator n=1 Tax=Sutcliffiella deserti TaxID=2875501 RepID=UPI001CBBB1C6|nr:TetR/AcrR family transcriptional regulator [Sutcliffiella deserti]